MIFSQYWRERKQYASFHCSKGRQSVRQLITTSSRSLSEFLTFLTVFTITKAFLRVSIRQIRGLHSWYIFCLMKRNDNKFPRTHKNERAKNKRSTP